MSANPLKYRWLQCTLFCVIVKLKMFQFCTCNRNSDVDNGSLVGKRSWISSSNLSVDNHCPMKFDKNDSSRSVYVWERLLASNYREYQPIQAYLHRTWLKWGLLGQVWDPDLTRGPGQFRKRKKTEMWLLVLKSFHDFKMGSRPKIPSSSQLAWWARGSTHDGCLSI